MVICSMVNDITKYSLSRLLLGYDMRTPSTWSSSTTKFITRNASTEVQDRIKVIEHLMPEVHEEVQEKTRKRQEQAKSQYDLCVKPRKPFKQGEQVLMKDQNSPAKLLDRWLGPMTVSHVYENGTYQLTGPNFLQLKGVINGNVFIPFKSRYGMVPAEEVQHSETKFQAWLEG
ncbi:hypothetical protein PHYBLDRAFT_161786 [Phycomyces blakesleeanus NRRL 1555(-)]|uniref:Uncharacterized protein n=1 Tax=Phycomyces blakesleeanus (strain ATCC 8743b / DSM 1359 / FGSC 10004 / NBRC 33097 / NRRL 1555) TaxID=763407 RepID=A0A162YJR2_PHYB8|nr:hypothetical protein PHYBLDRAFT_161786 [Phycomyces blakesleeanus NRRL 1555(-)]OAD81155.1 hypothetical protein PHYBLDRAFT_161786 [Phycomyces blakesleeanus NRRL 1555(-)]|eukprot:XP_018299195.1 hypothetical protein PHYBLDRAFT_161786 [Phycomyces blakesleeanus NRRL 1555(-)]